MFWRTKPHLRPAFNLAFADRLSLLGSPLFLAPYTN
jgi:hypothetical protein